jgi:hypothetical protein
MSSSQGNEPVVTPSPTHLRADLERMIVTELHGPVGGETEVIENGSVRDRYLVGALAPKGTISVDPDRNASGTEDGDDTESEAPVERPAARPALHPCSMGFTSMVTPGVERLIVEAEWGTYEKSDEPGAADGDKTTRVWRRRQVTARVEVSLVEGKIAAIPLNRDTPGIVLRGLVTLRERGVLVSLFLVNEQVAPERNVDAAWLFQVRLAAFAPTPEFPNGAPVFIGRRSVLDGDGVAEEPELDLQYRHLVEFAVGHGTAVHAMRFSAARNGGSTERAYRIETVVVPTYDVAKTEAPDAREEPALAGAVLDMAELSRLRGVELGAALVPLVSAYEGWLLGERSRVDNGQDGLASHREAAESAITKAKAAARRIRDGIDLLSRDEDAAEAFRFANEAMWQQRVRTTAAELRRADAGLDEAAALGRADIPSNRSWRPFQLGFVLLNLPSLTDPKSTERSRDGGLVDLLFFPTGGGKTEAYLGLTAYTFAIRRLQGEVAGHDGSGGVAVLMRYTLRLLTAQQFQRAAALVSATEVLRRQRVTDDPRWGATPFRIGLWVGSSLTPNRNRDALRAIEESRDGHARRGSQPMQLNTCPWCGRALDAARDIRGDEKRWRSLLFCSDTFGECPFTEVASGGEGIPVVTVDEEIYRLLPALVIATVDKFAQLPWQGPLHMLFGRVSRLCTRHGYRSPDLDAYTERAEADTHRPLAGLPAATTVDCLPLRPPDLIIQDELHLISGPLGTLVGLYESAIDHLCSWTVGGATVRPKVIASTATIRRAAEQVHALFWRRLAVFPPPVLDVGDSFFARQRDPEKKAGRRYVGICAPGQRIVSAEVRVFTAVLAAAQKLSDQWGRAADPWMTMVVYFNALRELGGARRLIEDDVHARLLRTDRRGLARRPVVLLRELTSRVPSSQITTVLDELTKPFDPDAGRDGLGVGVALATNMISVGVDVPRLGLMVAVGQPKATAEYIQATSRVGRADSGPGLVFTIYNWFRPRDLSHYESFEHYHATFYRQVEALSVTPFSPRALDRGLTAVLVATLRQHWEALRAWNPNDGAQLVQCTGSSTVDDIVEELAERAEEVSGRADARDLVRSALRRRLDEWSALQRKAAAGAARLGYRQSATTKALLEAPVLNEWSLWSVPNSLREAEPGVNLMLRDRDTSIDDAPPWQLGSGRKADVGGTAADLSPEEAAAEETDGTGGPA